MTGVIVEPITSIEAVERNFNRLNQAVIALYGGTIAIENIIGYENLVTSEQLDNLRAEFLAFKTAADSIIPVGTIMYYSGVTAPAGYLWLEPDTVYEKDDYPDLFALIEQEMPSLIVGSVQFSLADSRGNFFRGYDPTKIRDVDDGDRDILSQQNDAIRNLTGSIGNIAHSAASPLTASGMHQAAPYAGAYGIGGGGANSSNLYTDSSKVVPTGADNRPYNLNALAIVRAIKGFG